MPRHLRPIGRPMWWTHFDAPSGIDGRVVPDLPPLPVEVAVEVVRFARWRLTEWEESQSDRG